MARNPKKGPPSGITGPSRFDFRASRKARRLSYGIGVIVVLVALLWAFGAFDRWVDTAITPEPATTEGDALAPVTPAAPQ
jgi:hypothetical protein